MVKIIMRIFLALLLIILVFVPTKKASISKEIPNIIHYQNESEQPILNDEYFYGDCNPDDLKINIDGYELLSLNTEECGDFNVYTITYKKRIIPEIPDETAVSLPMGDYGCLAVPSVGLYMAIDYRNYMKPSDYPGVQQTIDDPNTCCMYNYFGNIIISDHYNHQFWRIFNIGIGDKIYIYKINGEVQTYTCTEIGQGKFPGVGIFYNGMDLEKVKINGIFLETCTGDDSVNTKMLRFQ